MTNIMMTQIEDEKWEISFSYDKSLVDMIKRIPSSQREWNPDKKVWVLFPTMKAWQFRHNAMNAGHYVESKFKIGAKPTPPTPKPTVNNWADQLLKDAPPELRPKIVKALAKVLHPDVGGNTKLMQQLNDASSKLGK